MGKVVGIPINKLTHADAHLTVIALAAPRVRSTVAALVLESRPSIIKFRPHIIYPGVNECIQNQDQLKNLSGSPSED
jgi:hypothetical protein